MSHPLRLQCRQVYTFRSSLTSPLRHRGRHGTRTPVFSLPPSRLEVGWSGRGSACPSSRFPFSRVFSTQCYGVSHMGHCHADTDRQVHPRAHVRLHRGGTLRFKFELRELTRGTLWAIEGPFQNTSHVVSTHGLNVHGVARYVFSTLRRRPPCARSPIGFSVATARHFQRPEKLIGFPQDLDRNDRGGRMDVPSRSSVTARTTKFSATAAKTVWTRCTRTACSVLWRHRHQGRAQESERNGVCVCFENQIYATGNVVQTSGEARALVHGARSGVSGET